ncbi:winged helix-turn-helix domain-containing protein [Patescibacteria group bacterium]|nr:winged helix-turn-helix domain-containing protein [Patescibacteria group bacterium]MBU1890396.1 winged helix-turn-helix domain-containing protein [Patescibacteria group bacterium]
MLEQLFGSATRVKLLRLFFSNPDQPYFVRELTRKLDQRINSIRQELKNLEQIGIVEQVDKNRKKYYTLRKDFPLYSELKSLMLKAQLMLEKDFVTSIEKIGQVRYLALTGIFMGRKEATTDMLVVGKVNRLKLKRLLHKFQEYFDKDINYTVMTTKEFEFRRELTDRFLYDVLENKKVVVIDKLPKPKKKK